MESEVQANKEVIYTLSNLFHPLTDVTVTFLPRYCRNPGTIDFSDPQPVVLNGNVYMKGCKSNGQHRIWKYSSSANFFSEILLPQGTRDEFLLTAYKSQLLLIETTFEEADDYDEECAENWNDPTLMLHKLRINVWELVNENKFERSDNIPFYEHRSGDPSNSLSDSDDSASEHYKPREPKYWDVRATSKNGNLLVAFYRQDNLYDPDEIETGWFVTVEILLFEETTKKWKHAVTTKFDQDDAFNDDDSESESTIIDRPSIIINDDTLCVKLWSESDYKDDKNYCGLKDISMKSLLDKWQYYSQRYNYLPSLVLPKGHSNLSVLNSQIIVGIPRRDELFLLALLHSKPADTWIEIARVKLDAEFDTTPCIMGLPEDNSILVIGMVKSVGPSPALQTLKLTSKVTAFNPSSRLTLSAINKLQIGADIQVLSHLEENCNWLQELAGFELNSCHDSTFYTRSLVPKYINSWADSTNCGLQLTWENFLNIMREMKLTVIAEQIQKFLTESTVVLEINEDQFLTPEATGCEQIAGLRKKLGALHQELDGEEATEAAANGSIKEKLKECVDQSQVAFHRIRMERECFQNQIDKLTKEKLELENKVEALEQQGPPTKRLRLSEAEDSASQPQPPTLKHVHRELYKTVANKWEDIGIQLDIDDGQLAKVKADNPGESGSCLREMLRIWLKKVNANPSWRDLVEALTCLGEEKLAQQLEDKYCA